ncbi:hypothetical protein BGZ59_003447 [Podila verticillata]|nr:hypothetical protein BGZ59_003447 [Podila verticillata]KFH69700.1 hypothetical protein MVEG_04506 [Podila verticillata NRRL 6337]
MLFSLPFWVVSAFANLVKLILRLFIGAILTFYVKYSQDEYASSIRWSRTGGLLEMIQLFWHSYRLVPRKSSAVLALAMVAGFSIMFVSSILTVMVSRADIEGSSAAARAFTKQLISADPSFWNVYLSAESTMEEALTAMLNDTRRNPNPRPKTRYTPRTYAYEAGCDESTAAITKDDNATFFFPSTSVNCKAYILGLYNRAYDWEPKTASVRTIDSSTFMVVTPVVNLDKHQTSEAIEPLFTAFEGKLCFRLTSSPERLDALTENFPEDGIITLPSTLATKCQYGSDRSLVSSVTYFQFAIGHMQDFDKVTATILDDPTSLPLLEPMYTAISDGAFSSPTNNSTMVMLTKIPFAASDVDFFGCISIYSKEQKNMGLLCTYMLTSIINVRPQARDPTIAADLKREPVPHNISDVTNQIEFTIFHLPQVPELKSSQGTTPLFSAAHLVKATTDASRYLASLGHNVNMYKDSGSIADQLYILYDAVELKDAYEVSTTAFAVVCAVTGLCGLAWAFSEYPKYFPTVYNSSLYKVVYKELKSKDESMPMLMRYTHDPLAFDGNQVADTDDQLNVAPGKSSEDHLFMVPLLLGNNVSKQQEQQPQMLEEIPAQSLHLNTRRIIASTPTMIFATPATTATATSTSWQSPTTQLQSLGSSAPPPIPARPSWFAHGTSLTSSVQAPPHDATSTTHGVDQTSAPSTHGGLTMIQNPFV